jgi:Transposase DDE domain
LVGWRGYFGFCLTPIVLRGLDSWIRRRRSLDAWLEQNQAPYTIEVVKRPADANGYGKLPRRWVVERTFAWLGRYRRNSKDDERLVESSESMIKIRSINHILILDCDRQSIVDERARTRSQAPYFQSSLLARLLPFSIWPLFLRGLQQLAPQGWSELKP